MVLIVKRYDANSCQLWPMYRWISKERVIPVKNAMMICLRLGFGYGYLLYLLIAFCFDGSYLFSVVLAECCLTEVDYLVWFLDICYFCLLTY